MSGFIVKTLVFMGKKLLTQFFFEKMMMIAIKDGLGHFVKKSESKVDDKMLAEVVEALEK